MHPTPEDTLQRIVGWFKFAPSFVNHITYRDADKGFVLEININEQSYGDPAAYPDGFNEDDQMVHISSRSLMLNEFGNICVSLFMLSNLARYYPDLWGYHVENNTALAFCVSHFVDKAKERMPLLAYSEVARRYYIRRGG